MTTKTTEKLFAYTVFENDEHNRVWLYYCVDRPELIPGFWNLGTDGIENKTAQEWVRNGNEWVRAMQALGCTYDQLVDAIRTVMGKQGFSVVEEFEPESVGAVDIRKAYA